MLVKLWCFAVALLAIFLALGLMRAAFIPPLGEAIPVDLRGRTFLVTGATSGLGLWQTEHLAAWNATLVLPVRDVHRGNQLADRLQQQNPTIPRPMIEQMDLNSIDSIIEFAQRYKGPVDVLVHNAATLGTGSVVKTIDGFEECFQVNYLSNVLLTSLLFERLEASDSPRVVFVSAKAHEWAGVSHDTLRSMSKTGVLDPNFVNRQCGLMGNLCGSYADSKLAQILFSAALDRRLTEKGVSMSLHPAIAQTSLLRDQSFFNTLLDMGLRHIMTKLMVKLRIFQDEETEAWMTQFHVSTNPSLQKMGGGRYYSPESPPLVNCNAPPEDCGMTEVSKTAQDKSLQEAMFEKSCDVLRPKLRLVIGGMTLCDRPPRK